MSTFFELLSGVLIFVEPGTVTQVYVGSLVTLLYVLFISQTLPYRDPQTNQNKGGTTLSKKSPV